MKLLNVSAGKVRTVDIDGESIRTAHIKTPCQQPWIIANDGVEGDERAVHPDKLYAFARSGYAYWGGELGVDPATWDDGYFGENLTLDTLDETDVRIGDEFSLGDEVRLFVSGARTPCVKLAWRIGQSRAFLGIFAKSRHTWAYFGVLRSGRVLPGDRLERTSHDPDMPSIADVCDYVSGREPPPLEPLRRLLAYQGLSPALRLLLGAKLETAERAARQTDHGWIGWRAFRIDRIVEEAEGIRSIYLRAEDDAPVCQPRPGQFVSVRMTDSQGQSITRVWSLSSFAPEMDRYRLTVRRQQGAGSAWIHAANVGDRLDLKVPRGDFALDMGSFRPLVLVAAGIGITPLLAMLHAHLDRGNAPPVHLIYGARTPDHAAFRTELEALAAARDDFTLTMAYSQCVTGTAPHGRIDAGLIKRTLHDIYILLDGRRIPVPWYESDIYLCGPGNFCRTLHDDLVALGANPDHLAYERFDPLSVAETELDEAQIHCARSGVTLHWQAKGGDTLLDLVERAGLPFESDCRAGACLTCRTRLIDGAVTSDLGDGTMLLCIGRPTTPQVTLDC